MITTVTPNGTLRSRPMVTQSFTGDGELWFFMSDDSGKARDLAQEHGVNVSYTDAAQNRFVSVSGNAVVRKDRQKIQQLWRPELERFFPAGVDDPHLALLCVRVDTAEYWDARSGKMLTLENAGDASALTDRPLGDHTRVAIRATPTSG